MIDQISWAPEDQKEKVIVPEIIEKYPIAFPLQQSLQDPPAVHLNEGGTIVSPSNDSVPVNTEKDIRLLLCQLKSQSLSLLPYLLNITLVFADHLNDSMNNTFLLFEEEEEM